MLVLCDPEHAGASGPWAPAQCVGLGRLAPEARRIQEAAPLKKALSGHPRAWTGPEPLRGHAVDHERGHGPGGVASPCLLGTPPGPLAATLLVMPHLQAHVGSLEVRCGHVALPGLWKSPRLLPRPREQGAPISCALCCSPKRSPSRASRPVLGRRGRRELLPYSFQTACPLGSGRDTPPCQRVAPAGGPVTCAGSSRGDAGGFGRGAQPSLARRAHTLASATTRGFHSGAVFAAGGRGLSQKECSLWDPLPSERAPRGREGPLPSCCQSPLKQDRVPEPGSQDARLTPVSGFVRPHGQAGSG